MKYVELGGSEALAGVGRASSCELRGQCELRARGRRLKYFSKSYGFHGLCRCQTETAKHKQR